MAWAVAEMRRRNPTSSQAFPVNRDVNDAVIVANEMIDAFTFVIPFLQLHLLWFDIKRLSEMKGRLIIFNQLQVIIYQFYASLCYLSRLNLISECLKTGTGIRTR